jgi:hypothetical protein
LYVLDLFLLPCYNRLKIKEDWMTESILDRWTQALGGLERLRQIETIYIRMTIETGGMSGTLDSWFTVQGQHRQDLDLGGIYQTRTVFDRGEGWFLDQNGKVRELAGTELEEETTSNYRFTFSHLVPERRTGRVEQVGEDTDHRLVLVQPEDGKPVRFYLDKATGLPTKEEQPQAERTQTTFLSEWREVDGVSWPFQMRQTTGDPRYDTQFAVEELRFDVPLEEGFFAPPHEAGPDFRFADGQSALKIPFELTSNHIYLQLQVNDSEPLWFILDTGAAASVMDRRQAERLGLELRGQLEGRGAGEGSVDVAFLKGACFRLPGVEVLDQTIAAISLEMLEPFDGRPMHGILGYDFISRFVVEIDYGDGSFSLHDPESYTYGGPGERVPLILDGNVPYIRAQLMSTGRDPVEGVFLMDTGARVALHLSSPFVKRHGLDPAQAITAPFGFGVGGETKQRLGRMAELRLGGIVTRDILTGFSEDVKGAGADPDRAGLIGGEILRRFKTIFDYKRQQMILEPNAHLDEPYEYDMSGLSLAAHVPGFDVFRVHRVVGNTPAAEVGLQEGDVILAIDGRPSGEYTLEEVRQLLKERGRKVDLQIAREEEELAVKLALRSLI